MSRKMPSAKYRLIIIVSPVSEWTGSRKPPTTGKIAAEKNRPTTSKTIFKTRSRMTALRRSRNLDIIARAHHEDVMSPEDTCERNHGFVSSMYSSGTYDPQQDPHRNGESPPRRITHDRRRGEVIFLAAF